MKKIIGRVFKKYKWNNLSSKYLKFIATAILIPFFIITAIVTVYNVHTVTQKIFFNDASTLLRYRNQFEKVYHDMLNLNNELSQDENVFGFIELKDLYSEVGYKSAASFQRIAKLLSAKLISYNVDSIYLVNFNIDYIFGSNGSGDLSNFRDQSWYELYKKNKYLNYVSARNSMVMNAPVKYTTFVFGYYARGALSGAVVINILYSNPTSNGTIMGVADGNGNIIQCSEDSLMNQNIFEWKEFANLDKPKDRNKVGIVNNNNSAISYVFSENTEFITFIKNPKLLTGTDYINAFLIFFVSIIIAFIATLIIAYFVTYKLYSLTANLFLLLTGAEWTEQGINLKKNEIMYIINTIVNNAENIDNLSYELSEKLYHLRKAQTITLQTQITPHFLYNTLQGINLVVARLCKGNNDASKMIVLFSDLLQTALDTKNYIIPLESEISHAKKYLDLQKYKYKNRFSVTWDIPNDIESLKVVKLCFQPVLENALQHGISSQTKYCNIEVKVIKQTYNFIITVSNDGIPIDPQKLMEINASFNSENIKENKNIGLYNVNRRIKLIFGNEYGCRISSENNKTIVTLNFPLD